jgi:hypothetical protein
MEGMIQAIPPANIKPAEGETWIHPREWYKTANGDYNFAIKQPDGSWICMDRGGPEANVKIQDKLPDDRRSNLYVVIFRRTAPPSTQPPK